jgi:rhodanese-related sulfurtransferase
MPKRPTIDAQVLRRRLASASPPLVVAPTTEAEHRRARIPGSRILGDVEAFAREVPRDRTIVVCARRPDELTTAWACRLLAEYGYGDVHVLLGGLLGWETAGLPVDRDP